MLMSRHSRVDALGGVWERAEVEGRTPAHLEVVGREVVVTRVAKKTKSVNLRREQGWRS